MQPSTTYTAGERQILRELDGAPDCVLTFNRLGSSMRALGLTPRGFGTVFNRLEAKNAVAWYHGGVTLTFKGMLALRDLDREAA